MSQKCEIEPLHFQLTNCWVSVNCGDWGHSAEKGGTGMYGPQDLTFHAYPAIHKTSVEAQVR